MSALHCTTCSKQYQVCLARSACNPFGPCRQTILDVAGQIPPEHIQQLLRTCKSRSFQELQKQVRLVFLLERQKRSNKHTWIAWVHVFMI